jgi:hypothetical protein
MTEESLIDQARKAAERLEKANKEYEELVKRQEALETRRILGGWAAAGGEAPVVEETPKEYRNRIMAGKS